MAAEMNVLTSYFQREPTDVRNTSSRQNGGATSTPNGSEMDRDRLWNIENSQQNENVRPFADADIANVRRKRQRRLKIWRIVCGVR